MDKSDSILNVDTWETCSEPYQFGWLALCFLETIQGNYTPRQNELGNYKKVGVFIWTNQRILRPRGSSSGGTVEFIFKSTFPQVSGTGETPPYCYKYIIALLMGRHNDHENGESNPHRLTTLARHATHRGKSSQKEFYFQKYEYVQ